MMPVITAPTSTPISGLRNAISICWNRGSPASGLIELLIMLIPVIRIAKPTRIDPRSFRFWRLDTIASRIPMTAKTSEKFSGFSIASAGLPLSLIPVSDRIHAVSVVPISEPIITLMV